MEGEEEEGEERGGEEGREDHLPASRFLESLKEES